MKQNNKTELTLNDIKAMIFFARNCINHESLIDTVNSINIISGASALTLKLMLIKDEMEKENAVKKEDSETAKANPEGGTPEEITTRT